MKLHKYYSILRPVMPGSYPNHDVVQVVNFDDRMYCEDIGEKAWGYILFQVPLAEKEVDAYELVSAEQKKYYAVTSAVYDDGRVTMKITDSVRAVKKPENTSKSLARKDIYVDWFESKKDAEDFIKENRGEKE